MSELPEHSRTSGEELRDMDDGASDRSGSTPASPQSDSLLQVSTSEGGGVGSPTKSHVLEPSDQQAGEHALRQGEGRGHGSSERRRGHHLLPRGHTLR